MYILYCKETVNCYVKFGWNEAAVIRLSYNNRTYMEGLIGTTTTATGARGGAVG